MLNNCMVILSKGVTPWDDYHKECELLAELNDFNGFVDICKKLVLMNNEEYSNYVDRTSKYIKDKLENFNDKLKYEKMLNKEMK